MGSFILNAFNGSSSRRSGGSPERNSPRNRRSPEPAASRPSRRVSRDTDSKQAQYSSSSYDEPVNYSQSNLLVQGWQMNSPPSTYSRASTTTPHNDEITVEVAEPEEMEPSGPEYASGYYHGRSSVQDGS